MIDPKTEGLTLHPLAELTPPMSEEQFEALCLDIENRQVDEPVILKDGQLIDGRHRWLACQKTGKPCPAVERGDDPGLEAAVFARNFHRKQLNASQLALYVARWAQRPRGRSANVAQATLRQEEAGQIVGVSRQLVNTAVGLLRSDRQDLIDPVCRGKLSLKAAQRMLRDTEAQAAATEATPTASPCRSSRADAARQRRARSGPEMSPASIQPPGPPQAAPTPTAPVDPVGLSDLHEPSLVDSEFDAGTTATIAADAEFDPFGPDDPFGLREAAPDLCLSSAEESPPPCTVSADLESSYTAWELVDHSNDYLSFLNNVLAQNLSDRQTRNVGMELLHFIGNLIWLAATKKLWPISPSDLSALMAQSGPRACDEPGCTLVGAALEAHGDPDPVLDTIKNPAVRHFLEAMENGQALALATDEEDNDVGPLV